VTFHNLIAYSLERKKMIALTLDHLLADSCSNPDVNWDPTKSVEENEEAADGWSIFTIELHCVTYTISAKKQIEGIMSPNDEWLIPPHFEIRRVTKE